MSVPPVVNRAEFQTIYTELLNDLGRKSVRISKTIKKGIPDIHGENLDSIREFVLEWERLGRNKKANCSIQCALIKEHIKRSLHKQISKRDMEFLLELKTTGAMPWKYKQMYDSFYNDTRLFLTRDTIDKFREKYCNGNGQQPVNIPNTELWFTPFGNFSSSTPSINYYSRPDSFPIPPPNSPASDYGR